MSPLVAKIAVGLFPIFNICFAVKYPASLLKSPHFIKEPSIF